MTPGTVCSTTHGSRDDGMFWSSSTLTFVDVVIFLVSTTGASPVTWHLRRDAGDRQRDLQRHARAGGDGDVLVQVVAEAGQLGRRRYKSRGRD